MTAPIQTYTVREVCALLRIGKTKVFALLKTGKLRSLKLGRCRRVRQTDLDRFMDRHRT